MARVEPAVRAENLCKSFGETVALDQVHIDVQPGECLGLLGANGAGKTTLCEILEGLQTPDSGQVEIDGLNFRQHRRQILERIGVQLQETALYKKYTVRETFALFASFYSSARSADSLISQLGLKAKADERVGNLSGGQRQAVYLGCALVNRPSILFLDEPTTGLDPKARLAVWDILEGLKQDGCSIFLTTHYLEEASRLADRVAIIDSGKIVAVGHPADLIRSHCGTDRLEFKLRTDLPNVSDENLAQTLRTTLPWLSRLTLDRGRCTVTGDGVSNRVSDLLAEADRLKMGITELSVRSSSLEDVYLKMTGKDIDHG